MFGRHAFTARPGDRSARASWDGWRTDEWATKVASGFFVGAGLLVLTSLPLTADDVRRDIVAGVAVTSCAIGAAVWVIPWRRWSPRASLVLVPLAFALIAVGNSAGGSAHFTYGVFFVVAFVWIGVAHPPRTSLAMAPIAAGAYLAPLPTLPEADRAGAVASALLVLPTAVAIGEIVARGLLRQSRIESDLERAREVEAMKDRFLRAASHELRTPIAICRGHLDVLGVSPGEAELRETVDLVTDELDRMARMIDEITTLTRLDDPRAVRIETLDVAELLHDVGAKAQPLFRERSLVVAPATGTVCADRQRLTQALLALLDNAATHASGATTVTLRAARERHRWRFAVADDASRMETTDGDPFEPFRHRSGSPGSGLGLAVVRAIAQAHGGAVGLTRDRRRGTEFWIGIPT